jgi:hypothetical protein
MIIGEEERKNAIADNLPNGANIKVSRKMTHQEEYEIKQINDLIEARGSGGITHVTRPNPNRKC